MTAGLEIVEFPTPAGLDGPDGELFRQMAALRNAVEAEAFGSEDLSYAAEELHPHWLDQHTVRYAYLALVDGRVVGRGLAEWAVETDDDIAWLYIQVLPDHRGKGIGSKLYELATEAALTRGKRTHQGYLLHRAAQGPVIASPTGFGSVPADDPGVRFALARGYRLEQVERGSRLALPADRASLDAMYEEALAKAGPDYVMHTWEGRTPEQWLEAIAVASNGMNTDAPSGGLEAPDDPWTADRVRDEDDDLEASPRTRFSAAVEHLPSGEFAGYTELSAPAEVDRAVSQEDTIVLKAHRGHRLGVLLKVANLRFLEERKPGHPSIVTFNAEENRHMLDVNEAMGFVPVVAGGGWRKDY